MAYIDINSEKYHKKNKIKYYIKCSSIRNVLKHIHKVFGDILLFFERKKYKNYLVESMKASIVNEKKILFICHLADKSGGASLLSYNMVSDYVNNGYQVAVIVLNCDELIVDFSKIVPTYICIYPRELRKLIKKFILQGYRYAICNSVCTGKYVKILKENGFVITSLICDVPKSIKKIGCTKDAILMAEYSDRILFISSYVRERFIQEISPIVVETKIIPQEIYMSLNINKSKLECKKIVAEKLELDIKKPIVISVGQISRRKGIDYFIQLSKLCMEVNFIWIGSSDGTVWSKKQIAVAEKIKNLILTGQINDKRMLSCIYRAANAFVLTSREDSFTSVVLESLNNGTPVIAFKKNGCYVDIIHNGKNGYLVNMGDIEMISKIIHNIFARDTNEYDEFCRKTVKGFNFIQYCDEVAILISSVHGGGTKFYQDRYLNEYKNTFLLELFNAKKKIYGKLYSGKVEIKVSTSKRALKELFEKIKPAKIIINSLYEYERIKDVLLFIMKYRKNNEISLVYMMHDYYCVCPNQSLFANSWYCNLACSSHYPDCEENLKQIINWRKMWLHFLMVCDEIRCFSDSSAKIITEAYPELIERQNIIVIPHDLNYLKDVLPVNVNSDQLHIGIFGNTRPYFKGRDIVKLIIKKYGNIIPISVVGVKFQNLRVYRKKVKYLGVYKQSNLRNIVQKERINLAIFPSLWPETFSYLVSELIQLDIPIYCYDLGAQGEKVNHYEKGRTFSKAIDLVDAIGELIEKFV